MAKKRFNVRSTLNKNKTEQAELAAKIPLRKTAKSEEIIKEKVDEIHEEIKAVPPPVIEKKVAAKPKRKKVEAIKESEAPKLVRLTIDTPANMHKRLKIQAIEEGMSMRDYILRLLERNLK